MTIHKINFFPIQVVKLNLRNLERKIQYFGTHFFGIKWRKNLVETYKFFLALFSLEWFFLALLFLPNDNIHSCVSFSWIILFHLIFFLFLHYYSAIIFFLELFILLFSGIVFPCIVHFRFSFILLYFFHYFRFFFSLVGTNYSIFWILKRILHFCIFFSFSFFFMFL